MSVQPSRTARRYSELSHFSSAEFRRIRSRALARPGAVIQLVGATMLFGIAAGIVLGILIVAFLALLKLLNPSPTLEHSLESGAYLAALLYILGVVILAVRLMDRLGLSLIREYIKSSLETASCPHCRQLLIGLPPRSGKITCPECGTSINLSDYDLSEVTWERIAAAQGSID